MENVGLKMWSLNIGGLKDRFDCIMFEFLVCPGSASILMLTPFRKMHSTPHKRINIRLSGILGCISLLLLRLLKLPRPSEEHWLGNFGNLGSNK